MANREVFDNILDTIGNTPIVRLNKVVDDIRTPVYAKCEFFNPGASVKDRIGLPIIEDAEARGMIRPGGTVVEGTSGNTDYICYHSKHWSHHKTCCKSGNR